MPYGVQVNSIAPGSFPDSVQMSAEDYQARQEVALEQVPLGRVNYLAVFLALPPPAYGTGKTWAVDGGSEHKDGVDGEKDFMTTGGQEHGNRFPSPS